MLLAYSDCSDRPLRYLFLSQCNQDKFGWGERRKERTTENPVTDTAHSAMAAVLGLALFLYDVRPDSLLDMANAAIRSL